MWTYKNKSSFTFGKRVFTLTFLIAYTQIWTSASDWIVRIVYVKNNSLGRFQSKISKYKCCFCQYKNVSGKSNFLSNISLSKTVLSRSKYSSEKKFATFIYLFAFEFYYRVVLKWHTGLGRGVNDFVTTVLKPL